MLTTPGGARGQQSATDAQHVNVEMLELRPRALWGAFRAEHFGFICIAIYLILEYLKPEQAYPIFALLPLLRFSLMGAIAGLFLDKTSRIGNSPFNWLICLFVLECVVSAWLAWSPAYAFEKFNIVTTWMIVFFLISSIVNTERRLFLFLLAYFLANFKMSQFGFFSWVSRGFGFASWGITGAGWFRNSGELGLEMSLFLAYTSCFIFFLRKYWGRWTQRRRLCHRLELARRHRRGGGDAVLPVLFQQKEAERLGHSRRGAVAGVPGDAAADAGAVSLGGE
jgi:hypothetical protein